MTTYAAFGSTPLGPQSGAPVAEDPSILGEVSKGVSRGGRELLGSGEQALGLGAEALGFDNVANRLRAGAQDWRNQAAAPQFAPESPDWASVHGVGQGLRWAAGHAGNMLPLVGGAALGTALSGGNPVVGAATMFPDMVGQIDQGQQADPTMAALPVGERLRQNLPMALAGTAAMALPVGGAVGKMVTGGAPARSLLGAVGRNVAEGAATGYAGMGGANVATQMGINPEAPIDWQQANEAGTGGAVAMGLMHAPGAVGSYVKGTGQGLGEVAGQAKLWGSKKLEAMRQGATDMADAAPDQAEAAGKKVGSFYDDMSTLTGKAFDKTRDFASRIAEDKPVGVDDATLSRSTPEQIREFLAKSDQTARQWAQDAGETMMSKLSPENQEKLTGYMADLSSAANRAGVATLKMANDASSSVSARISSLHEKLKPKDDGTKKSEDYSAPQKAILEGLTATGFLKRRTDISGNNRSINELAGSLRMMFDQMTKGQVDPELMNHMERILGDDYTPVINSVKKSLKDNLTPAEFQSYFTNLNAITEVQKRNGDLHESLSQLLGPDHQNMSDAQKKEMTDAFVAHARGDHTSSTYAAGLSAEGSKAHDTAINNLMTDTYKKMFGGNADAAAKLVQEHTKLDKGDEHTGSTEYTDDGEEVALPKEKVPHGQSPMYDENGERVTAEETDDMKFGLSAPDKAGNQKSRRNGRPYLDPDLEKARGVEKAYATRHLAELRAKYPDKMVNWEASEGNPEYGHITVSERPNPENVTDESVDLMKLDTHKYPKSKSRMEFDVGAKTEKGDPKPLILDTQRIAGTMRGRLKQGAEPDLSFAHTLKRGFVEGIAALTHKFGVNPTIPDEAIIGHVGGEPFTWGMAQKLTRTSLSDSWHDEDMAQLRDMEKRLFEATASQAEIAAAQSRRPDKTKDSLKQTYMHPDNIEELEKDINTMYRTLKRYRDMELAQGDEMGMPYDPNTAALRKLDPNVQVGLVGSNTRIRPKKWYEDQGVETHDGKRYLKDLPDLHSGGFERGNEIQEGGKPTGRYEGGRITAEGLRMLLEGDYHGGFTDAGGANHAGSRRVPSRPGKDGKPTGEYLIPKTTHGEIGSELGDAAIHHQMSFDPGTGQREIGKDDQIHLAMAGGKDDPFFGRDHESSAPQQPDKIVRGNQDGTPHFVSDRWDDMRRMQAMGHELQGKTSVIAKGLGEKLVALAQPDVLARMHPAAIDALQRASLPGITNSSRARLLNMLTEDFTTHKVEEHKMTDQEIADKAARRKPSWKPMESEVDYSERHIANQTLLDRIAGMSDDMAKYELRRRERLLEKATPGSDFSGLIESEVAALKERLGNGRQEPTGVEYQNTPNALKYKRELDLFGKANQTIDGADGLAGQYAQGRLDARPRFSSVGEEPGTRYTGVAEGNTAGAPTTNRSFGRPRVEQPGTPGDGSLRAKPFLADGGAMRKTPGLPEGEVRRAPNPKAVAAKKAALLEAASSFDPALHEQLATATDAKSLQRTVDHLSAAAKPNEGTVKAIEIANKRMGELVKGSEDVGYGLQTRKQSLDASKATGPEADAAKRAAVETELKRIAPKVSVAWKGLSDMAYAGDYNHAMKAIRLSVAALNPMSTGYHEALHHFLASMRDAGAHDVADVLQKAAGQDHVIKQLNDIYKGNADVLKQLADPEERAAYMFQHWSMDKSFKVSMKANTVFGRIKEFVNNLMGNWTNSERALHIMDYFHSGEYAKNADRPNVVRRALMEKNRSNIVTKARELAGPLGELADSIVSAGSARLRDSGIPALRDLADIVKLRDTDASGSDRGYIQAARIEGAKQINAFGEALHAVMGEPPADTSNMKGFQKKAGEAAHKEFGEKQQRLMSEALESLQRNEKAPSAEGRLMAHTVKKILRETRDYMVKAGVDVGDLGPDYFHRVWDTHYISKNQQAFRDMLEPYIRSGKMKGTADQLLKNLTSHNGTEFGLDIDTVNGKETLQPGMQATKRRVLDFIDPRDAAEFLNKDLMGTMSSYIGQAVRKAEWTKRMGNGKLEALVQKARQQGATEQQLNMAEDYLKGVDGTLGDDINATQRRLTGDLIVYQNVRLLPMASFSMFIDPLGTMVRGAKAGEAWNTFTRGMKGIAQTFSKEGGELHDQQTKWAELVGVVDSAMMNHAMGDAFTQGMVGGTAKRINDTFFKYNFVEGLNRNFRIGATESAMKFIQRHADGTASTHSDRWIKELGLTKADIKTTKDGHLALTEADGLTKDQVTKVHAAVNQWVDGSILRPDAADKPIWMNDPHYALIAHLKQFVYSFQHTILARVAHEANHGNYTPAMALASYVPVMLAADFAKGAVLNGGDTPDWQKGWGMADYVDYAIQRSGIYGVSQFGLDVAKDIHRGNTGLFALSGPSIEQLRDAVETVGGHKQFSTTGLDAMPANSLYKHYLGAPSTEDVKFAD